MLAATIHANVNRRQHSDIYIALQDVNFEWSKTSIEEVLDWWNQGMAVNRISQKISRDVDEIVLMIMDLGNHLFLPRSHGIHASRRLSNFSPNEIQNKARFFRNHHPTFLVFNQAGQEFFWKGHDVITIEILWNAGMSIRTMSKRIKRDSFDIILLIIDRCKQQRIQPRVSGLDGHT